MEAIHNWLIQAARTYGSPNRVVMDVEGLLVKYPSLRPKTAPFTYETGQAVSLLCIEGTVPIVFRGSQYNIPINIWLHRNYPLAPPSPFVVPTATMLVKPSKHVDSNGKVYMPYLHHWATQPDQSSMLHMVALMIDIFSQMPPLFSRPPSGGQSQNPSTLGPPPGAIPSSSSSSSPSSSPSPAAVGMNPQNPHISLIHQQQRPQSPVNMRAKSPSPGFGMYPSNVGRHGSFSGRSGQHSSNFLNNISQAAPPQVQPPLQEVQEAAPRDSIQVKLRDVGGNREAVYTVPLSMHDDCGVAIQRAFEKAGVVGEQAERYCLMTEIHSTERILSQENPLEVKMAVQMDDPSREPHFFVIKNNAAEEERQEEEKIKRESLLSAVSEKLHRRVYQMTSKVNMEVDQLVSENNDLKNRQRRLEVGLEQMRNTTEEVRKNSALLAEKKEEADKTLEALEANPELNVDEAIRAAAPVYEQWLDLVAHELAIEDALYCLTKALDKERIDPAAYLKNVRNLAREQFFKKALIQKIREGVHMA